MTTNELFLASADPFVLFPVVAYSYEFALAAQRVIAAVQPVAVAVNYPRALEDLVQRAIVRLPRISVISYGTLTARRYLRLEPVDAAAEVSRLALAAQLPWRAIGVQHYPQVTAMLPDTYALQTIGHQRYVAAVLQRWTTHQPLILDATGSHILKQDLNSHHDHQQLVDQPPPSASSTPPPALDNSAVLDATAIFTAKAMFTPKPAATAETPETTEAPPTLEESLTATVHTMAQNLWEWARKLQWSGKLRPGQKILVVCELPLLKPLQESLSQPSSVTPAASPSAVRLAATLSHLHPQSLGEIMSTFPFLTAVYEQQRITNEVDRSPQTKPIVALNVATPSQQSSANFNNINQLDKSAAGATSAHFVPTELTLLEGQSTATLTDIALQTQHVAAQQVSNCDRQEILNHYLLATRRYYEQEVKALVNPQQLLLLHRFGRKYATIKKLLIPDFYELLIAGRGCFDDHFCYRLWEMGTCYPLQSELAEIPTIKLRAPEVFPAIQRVRMNPNAPLRPRASLPRFLHRRDKQKASLRDSAQFDPHNICSYPPEDICLENYGRYLRHKGKAMLSESEKRIQPFEASLLDGIDIRETLRNWHTGKIYVQEARLIKGSVDSLVVIFDENVSDYPYQMTWLGEHEAESDMAFYATDPALRTVAPGINKALYGGFLMTLPPGRLYDVFRDPTYRQATTLAERLLFAAIDYSLEKFVIYAALHPPRPFFQVLAGRYGKRIIYIPLKQLSPVMLQKIRTFHILADKSVRQYAGDHIW